MTPLLLRVRLPVRLLMPLRMPALLLVTLLLLPAMPLLPRVKLLRPMQPLLPTPLLLRPAKRPRLRLNNRAVVGDTGRAIRPVSRNMRAGGSGPFTSSMRGGGARTAETT
jgi:hypothetical protein